MYTTLFAADNDDDDARIALSLTTRCARLCGASTTTPEPGATLLEGSEEGHVFSNIRSALSEL